MQLAEDDAADVDAGALLGRLADAQARARTSRAGPRASIFCTTFRYISSKSAGTPVKSVGLISAMRSRMRRRSFSNVTSPPTAGATTAVIVNGKAWCIGRTTIRAVALSERDRSPDRAAVREEVAVGQRHALHAAGRAGCEHDRCGVVRPDLERTQRTPCRVVRARGELVERDVLRDRRAPHDRPGCCCCRAASLRRIADDDDRATRRKRQRRASGSTFAETNRHARFGVGHHRFDLGSLEFVVQRHGDAAGKHDRVVGADPFDAVLEDKRHAVALLDAEAGESCREVVGARIDIVVGVTRPLPMRLLLEGDLVAPLAPVCSRSAGNVSGEPSSAAVSSSSGSSPEPEDAQSAQIPSVLSRPDRADAGSGAVIGLARCQV